MSFSRPPQKNPYASTSFSSASADSSSNDTSASHALTRVLHHPSPDALQRFQDLISSRPWTLRLAEKLVEAALDDSKPHVETLLVLLCQVLVTWDDAMLYAMISMNQERLLGVLMQFIQKTKSSIAIAALAHVFDALDRLQTCSAYWSTSISHRVDTPPWWCAQIGDDQKLTQVAHVTIELLLARNELDDLPASDTATKDVRSACASYLCSLLKYDIKDWIYDLDDMTPLIHQLLHDTQALEDPNVTCASTIRLAFASVALLSALLWKHHIPQLNFSPSGGVVDHVSKVAFPAKVNSPHGPRWTYEPVASTLRPHALSLLSVLSLTEQQKQPSERYWHPFVESSWRALLESKIQVDELTGLLFLLTSTSCRLSVRRCLQAMLAPNLSCSQDSTKLIEGCRVLIASLLNHCQHNNLKIATSSAALIRTLLMDRQDVATHDEISRAFWSAMDSFPLERLLDGIVKLSSNSNSSASRACQPLLLCMMDIVELLLFYPEGSRIAFMDAVGTQRIQSLIDIMSLTGTNSTTSHPTNRTSDTQDSMEEETPPANNLSRLDSNEVSRGLEDQESSLLLKGLDKLIRVAAATILTRMGYTTPAHSDATTEQGHHALTMRIRTAIYDFVAGLRSEASSESSFGYTRRLVRLQSLLASCSSENEILIATTLSEVDKCHRKELQDRHQVLLEYERQLEEARLSTRMVAVDKDKFKSAMRSQALVFSRDLNRVRKQATAETDRLVDLHASERAKAESRLEEFSKQASEAEASRQEALAKLEAAQRDLEETRAREASLLSESEQALRDLGETRAREANLQSESDQAQRDLSLLRDELQNLKANYETSQKDLHSARRTLTDTKHAYGQLQDELEVVFSNLSALAQIYEAKEGEVTAIVEHKDRAVQEARRQSDQELRRNEELQENQTRLELENERLKKKYARAKEKLEAEREARQEEETRRKRSGPVSYINQLHNNSRSSDRSDRDKKVSHADRKVLPGKENPRSSSSRDYYR